MKIGIIGAAGKAGSQIFKEATDRGHDVTAIVRNPSKLTDSSAKVIEKDIFDLTASDLTAFDVVVNAFAAPFGQEHLHVEAGRHLIEALKSSKTKLFVVGGAGSLYVDEEKTLKVVDTPDFPEVFKPTALNQGKNLEDLKNSDSITWTFLSPSAIFANGKRTGSYSKGKDILLTNSKGNSYVSYEDYAITVLDELENPQHENKRFTVCSEEE